MTQDDTETCEDRKAKVLSDLSGLRDFVYLLCAKCDGITTDKDSQAKVREELKEMRQSFVQLNRDFLEQQDDTDLEKLLSIMAQDAERLRKDVQKLIPPKPGGWI